MTHIDSAIAGNFDFDRFFIDQEVHATSMNIYKIDLNIELDESKPDITQGSSMPQDLMRKIPFYIHFDTLQFQESAVDFNDKEPDVKDPALLNFEEINVYVYNFTNDTLLMTDTTPGIIEGRSRLLGEGMLSFKIVIPLMSHEFDAKYTLGIDSMDGKKFNDFLLLAGLKLEDGIVLPSELEVEVNNGSAVGNLRFEYDHLHIKVVDPKTEKASKFKSLLGNFMVKNSNPKDAGDAPEIVPVCGRRIEDDSFFYFVWRVLRDGIIVAVTKDTIYNATIKQ
jgi:hypothetical protein